KGRVLTTAVGQAVQLAGRLLPCLPGTRSSILKNFLPRGWEADLKVGLKQDCLPHAQGCLSVFGINTTVGVEHARPILLMCRNYCRLLEGSSMLDPYNEHHPETGYAPKRWGAP